MPLLAQATFGDTTIPASQALPPAGLDQVAFRPACAQVVPVGQGNGTAWTLPMPDGEVITLLELPRLDTSTAWKELDSYGLCKVGGDIVPIIYSRQLPQRSMASPVAEASSAGGTQPADLAPSREPASGGLIGLAAGSVLLLTIAAGVVAYSRRKPKAPSAAKATPKAKQGKGKPPQRVATRRNDLDDLLGGE